MLTGGLGLGLAGLAVGAAGAWLLGRWLSSLLYGLGPLDPVSWVATAVVLMGVTAAAAWIPARRVTRVDLRSILGGS